VTLLPYVDHFGVAMNIDRNSLSVTVTGSVLSNFADVITELFKGPICDQIEIVVVGILNTYIPRILNKKF